ncbi:hypothetical protein V496_01940 [Pseudogymnoascus sp. VKM F-4515 (FW-2607)]|nr:hypothetical protein V496_01940 [Pseudogymnoascus sp. VKM F-4515 (FW-2607)]KFY91579.1 hypothetical protein V498_05404 [Pseudogymnoascus sp. VKM F-4517 (FW-2822)]
MAASCVCDHDSGFLETRNGWSSSEICLRPSKWLHPVETGMAGRFPKSAWGLLKGRILCLRSRQRLRQNGGFGAFTCTDADDIFRALDAICINLISEGEDVEAREAIRVFEGVPWYYKYIAAQRLERVRSMFSDKWPHFQESDDESEDDADL